MERQRSFSFKSTGLLVFSFIISSSFIFITSFTLWVLKSTPLNLKEASFLFNRTSPVSGITAKTFTGDSNRNSSSITLQSSVLLDTHFTRSKNSSGFAGISVVGRDERERSGVNGSLTTELGSVLESSSANIKVKKSEKTDVDFILRDKIEAPSNESDAKVKIGSTSVKKIEALSEGGKLKEERRRGKSVVSIEKMKEEAPASECDLTVGEWVYDESYPLYTNSSCRIIDEGFDCLGNGRLDKSYMKWRWKPRNCDTERY